MAREWFFLVLLNSSSFSAILLSHLSQLELGPQHLVLLSLEGTLGLLKGGLEF